MKITRKELIKIAERDCPLGHSPINPVWILNDGEISIKSALSYNGEILTTYEPYGINAADVTNVMRAMG